MTRKGERVLGRIVWAGAILLAVATAGVLTAATLVAQREISPTTTAGTGSAQPLPRWPSEEVEAFSRKRMSKPITRPVELPPAPPPRSAAPPLDSIVRLAGIADFGDSHQAMIEILSGGETKGYQVGDILGQIPATVRSINEEVTVEYDGKIWKLTYGGARELPPGEDTR